MATTQPTTRPEKLPGRFEQLVSLMPPRAIRDEVDYDNTVEMTDRLMAGGKLTQGQELYLETLVQLIEHYDAEHYAIDVSGISGLDSLGSLLDEQGMNASDLARLLGVHPSMGSKLMKGERRLTVDHMRKLGERFKVNPSLFM
jgi:HTH-type transcriptional regulator/antitoxin HigA